MELQVKADLVKAFLGLDKLAARTGGMSFTDMADAQQKLDKAIDLVNHAVIRLKEPQKDKRGQPQKSKSSEQGKGNEATIASSDIVL